MKKCYPLALGLAALAFSVSHAQEEVYWQDMMKDPNANFYDVKKKAEKNFKTRGTGKGSGYKQYQRWVEFMEPRVYPSGNMNIGGKAWEAYHKMMKTRDGVAGNWIELGPNKMDRITSSWAPGIGRVSAISVDPSNKNTMYVGAPIGGIWKSTTGGDNWIPLGDNLPVMGVNSIAVDPNDGSTIYIATGDQNAHSYSVGVLKSTDGGATWDETGLSYAVTQGKIVYKVLSHPSNSSIVFAATADGIFKTTNGGTSWSSVHSGRIEDIEFKPGDPNTVYACGSRFYISTNGGDSFSTSGSGAPTSSKRQRIAVTAANPSYVYLLSARNDQAGSFGGVYQSTNSGSSFTGRNTNQGLFDFNIGGASAQSWWNICFGASQTDADEVCVGGKVTYISFNGGGSWEQTSEWTWNNPTGYIHCDMQSMLYVDGTLFTGSDGLICKSNNGGKDWTEISDGLGIRQFQGVGVSRANSQVLGGGSQDNGTSVYYEGEWREWLGADGGDVAIDHNNPQIIYGVTQAGNSVHKSTNGGTSYTNMSGHPTGGQWGLPLDIDGAGNAFFGYSSLNKVSAGGSNFQSLTVGGSGNIVDICISPSNDNLILVAKTSGVYKSTNGSTFSSIGSGISGRITGVAVHPTNDQILAVSVSGYTASSKVYYSTNGGSSWTNVSSGLPNIPCNAVAIQEENNGVYVGTDIGVFYKDDVIGDWVDFSNGFPRTLVKELVVHEGDKKVIAATFGRGMWMSDLYGGNLTGVQAKFSGTPTSIVKGNSVNYTDESRAFSGSITSWDWTFEGGNPSSADTQDPGAITYSTSGDYDVTLIVSNGSESDTLTRTNYIEVLDEQPVEYCDASHDPAKENEMITEVTMSGENNTGISKSSLWSEYGEYTDEIAEVKLGGTYTIEATVNMGWNNSKFGGWIDWNHDGDFDDAGELVIEDDWATPKYNENAPYTVSFEVTVPEGAALTKTRMRLRVFYIDGDQYTGPFSPCGELGPGEVEDYSIKIFDSLVGLDDQKMEHHVNIFPNPASDFANIDLSYFKNDVNLEIINYIGEKVYEIQNVNDTFHKVDVSDFAAGMYLLRIRNGEDMIIKKFQIAD